MSPEERERMNWLCARIQEEKDQKRFTELVMELNALFEKKKRIGLRTRGRRPTKHTIFGTQNHDGAGESTQYRPEDRPNFFIKAGSAIRKAAASSGTRMNIVAGSPVPTMCLPHRLVERGQPLSWHSNVRR